MRARLAAVIDDFVVARNPDPQSALPYLIRVPLGSGVVLKARDSWPRHTKIYCHRADGWPDDAEVVERVPLRSCVRRGPAIELVARPGPGEPAQLVFTRPGAGRWSSGSRPGPASRPAQRARSRPRGPPAWSNWRSSSTPRSATRTGSPTGRRPPVRAALPGR